MLFSLLNNIRILKINNYQFDLCFPSWLWFLYAVYVFLSNCVDERSHFKTTFHLLTFSFLKHRSSLPKTTENRPTTNKTFRSGKTSNNSELGHLIKYRTLTIRSTTHLSKILPSERKTAKTKSDIATGRLNREPCIGLKSGLIRPEINIRRLIGHSRFRLIRIIRLIWSGLLFRLFLSFWSSSSF